MLRIEEIVGAMDDEFRYALDDLSDERLVALKGDQAALRRMCPVGVSTAEAMAMIESIQQQRARKIEQDAEAEHERAERAAKRKASPRKKKVVAVVPVVEPVPEPVPVPEPMPEPVPEPVTQPVVELSPEPEPEPPLVTKPIAAQPLRSKRLLLLVIPVLLTVLALLAG